MIGLGDIVVRTYAYNFAEMPGTVIDVTRNNVDVTGASGLSYEEHVFTIAWCDGSISVELDLEVVPIEDLFEAVDA